MFPHELRATNGMMLLQLLPKNVYQKVNDMHYTKTINVLNQAKSANIVAFGKGFV